MAPEAYEFGEFRVDLRTVELTRNGQPVPLEPKAFDVLRCLIEGRDRLLTKDQLLDLAWRDTFVTPNALTRVIVQLRRALGDDAEESRFIATVAKRGYRWIAPVRAIGGSPLSADTEATRPTLPVGPNVVVRRRPLRYVAVLALTIALGAVGWVWSQSRHSEPAAQLSPQTPTRLTVRSGYDGTPAISADGRIAYTSDVGGSLEIWVTGSTPGARATALTNDGGQNDEPAWSADGQLIAFSSRKRGGIWVVPSTGGAPRQVAEVGSEPTWSADGRHIAFSSDAGGMASQSVLMIVDRDGSGLRELTKIGAPPGGHREPVFSPDGSHVAFSVFSGGWTGEVWLSRVSDGQVTRVVTSASASRPQFNTRGDQLYWKSRGELWRLPIDPASLKPSGEPVRVHKVDGWVEDWSMTPAGVVVYSTITDDANLWIVDTDSAHAEPRRLTNLEVRATYPGVSRDGRVAYTQIMPGQGVSVWLTDVRGATPELLTEGAARGVPQWSADGRRVLLRRGAIDEGSFAWFDLATRRFTPLDFSGAGIVNATLSPADSEIAYHRIARDGPAKGSVNIFVRPIAGGAETQLTFDREAIAYPAWSPDGLQLGVEVKRASDTHVGVVPRRGGPVRMLTKEPGQSFVSAWSADGEWIIYAAERNAVWNVLGVSPRTGTVREFTHFKSANGYVRYAAMTRDGAQIVFERNTLGGSLWTTTVR